MRPGTFVYYFWSDRRFLTFGLLVRNLTACPSRSRGRMSEEEVRVVERRFPVETLIASADSYLPLLAKASPRVEEKRLVEPKVRRRHPPPRQVGKRSCSLSHRRGRGRRERESDSRSAVKNAFLVTLIMGHPWREGGGARARPPWR